MMMMWLAIRDVDDGYQYVSQHQSSSASNNGISGFGYAVINWSVRLGQRYLSLLPEEEEEETLRQVQCGGGLRASHSKYECAPFQSVRGTTCTVGRIVMAKGARRPQLLLALG